MASEESVLVIGATGRVGGAVVNELAGRVRLRALVRDPGRATAIERLGVDLVTGSLEDPGIVRRAMVDIDRVFLCCGHDHHQAELEGHAVEAARLAGVRQVVKLSGGSGGVGPKSASPIGRAHWRVERQLAASGLPHSILRPGPFMHNLLEMAPLIAHLGVIAAPMLDARVALIDVRDIAAVAAAELTGEPAERVLELTGPEALPFARVAAFLSEATGRRVVYVSVPVGLARLALERRGTPGWLLEHQLAAIELGRAGAAAMATTTVGDVTGREPRTFAQFAAEHADAFRRRGGVQEPFVRVAQLSAGLLGRFEHARGRPTSN